MDSDFRASWLTAVLGLSLDIRSFGRRFKMAFRFTTVSKDEILAVNEAAAPKNTKKETKFGLSAFTGL